MKKQLDTSFITSELRGSSAFFPNYKKNPSPTSKKDPNLEDQDKALKQEPEVKSGQGVPPPVPRTVPRSVPLMPKVKRVMRQRQPFDIYEDQYDRLKRIAEAEKGFINGRGMSQMIRTAIDNYLRDNDAPEK